MVIKDNYLRITSCLVILILGLSLVPVAAAITPPPSIPNVFEGSLIAGGADAPVGTVISAYIDSELAGMNTVTEPGKYKLGVTGTEEDNGKTITFKLGNIESEPVSVTYQHGALPAELDLTFKGDFVAPVIGTSSSSPAYILNDGKDFSVIRVKVVDESSGVASVTLDLSPIIGGTVSLTPEGGDMYTCNVVSNPAGEFKFAFTATDYFGNKVTAKDKVFLTVLQPSQLATRYGGSDGVFSAAEIEGLVNDNSVSSGIKYTVLAEYFADGWDLI